MGFRDFMTFDIVLVAKHWILNNPEDFWLRILKGIYFPHSSFLEARKGSRASWVLSSLIEEKKFAFGKALLGGGK